MIVGAGRTDSGVHAFGQVVTSICPHAVLQGTRSRSRATHAFVEPAVARTNQSARRPTGRSRLSRPFLSDVARIPLPGPRDVATGARSHRRVSWSVQGRWNIDAMNRVSDEILGLHDFRAFCRRPTNSDADEPLLRRVTDARWERLADEWALTPDPVAHTEVHDFAPSRSAHNMVPGLTRSSSQSVKGRFLRQPSRSDSRVSVRDHLPVAGPASGLALVAVKLRQRSSILSVGSRG